jgi:biopolymer transport protein ExbD
MNRDYRRKRAIAEINITPLTDVILVLLIVFMIATPLLLQSNIKIKLPQASHAQPITKSNQANVVITDEGMTYLNNELVTKKELNQKISGLYKENPDLAVLLQADKLCRFKDIVEVLDIINGLGIKNLNIATASKE